MVPETSLMNPWLLRSGFGLGSEHSSAWCDVIQGCWHHVKHQKKQDGTMGMTSSGQTILTAISFQESKPSVLKLPRKDSIGALLFFFSYMQGKHLCILDLLFFLVLPLPLSLF